MEWLRRPSVYIFLVLMAIAISIIAQPTWPARGQEFLLVLFACTALALDRTR